MSEKEWPLREIVRPKFVDDRYKPTGRACPSCGGALVHGPIACPDGRPGCIVLHYGYRCGCGKDFQ